MARKSSGGNFILYFKLFTLLVIWPGLLIGSIIKQFKGVASKKEVVGYLFGIWLITAILPFAGVQGFAMLSIYLFVCLLTTLVTYRLDEEAAVYVDELRFEKKQQRLEKRLNKKNANSTNLAGDEEEVTAKYSWSQIVERIEILMVGSGFYKAEDEERLPGYYLADFYEVTGLNPNGDFQITMKTPPGKRAGDMDKFEELLASGMDYHSAVRYSEPGDTAGIAKFTVYAEEPETNLRDFTSKEEGVGNFSARNYININDKVSLTSIPIGVFEDKSMPGLLTVDAFQNHYLIGGTTGGGKSVTGAIIACQVAKTNAIMYGIDLKQTELEIMSDRFAAIAQSHEEALIMLQGLVKEMTRRNTYLKSIGATKLDINDPKNPPVVILIDEFAELMAPESPSKEDKDRIAEIDKLVRSISQLSRSVSFSLIIMTQSPKADIINTQLRNNLMNRIGLFTSTTSQLQTIIGEAALDVDVIKKVEQAGWFVGGRYDAPVKFKSLFLTDKERSEIIRKYKGNRDVIHSKAMDEYKIASWHNFVHRLVDLTDDGIGKMERINDTVKLAHELNMEDGKIIYDYMTTSDSFMKIMAEHYGGYSHLDAFVEAYDKRNILVK